MIPGHLSRQATTRSLAQAAGTGLRLRWAVVHATHAGPPATVDLYVDGSSSLTTGVRYLASYTPVVNDTVAVLEQPTRRGPDYLVLGKTA